MTMFKKTTPALAIALVLVLAGAGNLQAQDRSRGSGQRGRGGQPQGASQQDFFKSAPLAKSDEEQKILDVLKGMQEEGRGMQSVPMDDGRFLRIMAETTGAKHIVELGTSQGYSAVWFCLALRQTGGKLTTYEIDPERAERAKKNFEAAGVSDLVTLVLGDAHEEITKLTGTIDLIFLDADKTGYIDYLEKLLPLLRPGGMVIAHNVTTRQGDPKYIEAITTNPDLESILVNMQASTVSVSLKKH
jgi:caffeoyl-CoA O-methyltransferase